MNQPHTKPGTLGAAAILLALLIGSLPAAAGAETVLGPDGELLRVLLGSYGELFPDGTAVPDKNVVLALEITRGDSQERLLVPGTGGADIERSASVVYERGSDTLYIAWSSLTQQVHAEINLLGRSGEEWGDVIEVSGNPYSFKSTPRVAVTRDTLPGTESEPARQRTILHTVWQEEAAGAFYAPLVLIDGEFQSPNRVHRLSAFSPDPTEPPDSGFAIIEPMVVPGPDLRSVTIAFTHEVSGELVTLTARPLPGALTAVAAGAERLVLDAGLDPCSTNQAEALASQLGDVVFALGESLSDSLRSYLAAQAEALVDPAARAACNEPPEEALVSVAEEARAHIVLIGARETSPGPIDRIRKARAHIVLIGLVAEGPRDAGEVEGQGSVSRISRFAATTSERSPDRLFLAADGRSVIAAWLGEEGRIRHREAIAGEDGWSDVMELILGEDFTLLEAWDALEGRLRSR